MLGGAAAALVAAPLLGAPAGLAAVAGALGALLPDLDTPQSKGARALPFAAATAVALATAPHGWTSSEGGMAVGVALAWALPRLAHRFVGHRAALHAPAVHVLLTLVGAMTLQATDHVSLAPLAVAAGLGSIVGGLALDACTIRGVPLLWPWRHEPVHLVPARWRCRTGGRRELVVRLLLAALLAAVVFHGTGTASAHSWTSPRPRVQGPAAASPPRSLRDALRAPLTVAAVRSAEGSCGGRGGRPPAGTTPCHLEPEDIER
jgi:membrane-bound metal-dependent hydrolase YbcI (DUF457 family)